MMIYTSQVYQDREFHAYVVHIEEEEYFWLDGFIWPN